MTDGEASEQGIARTVLAELRTWPARRWLIASATTLVTVLAVAVPTDLIPNPWFWREMPPTPWAWPVLIITGTLSGLVAATYVARKDTATTKAGALGMAGAFATFFAVGCPVCNKLVLLALGYAGALQFFEPLQPYLAGGSILLLGIALVMRIRRERACPLPRAMTEVR
ncbi:hypothetical protein [Microbacterium sp. H1-D42]|uniref:hypothetical protein n=1 Tax=Microbacterium sp. H1-D42 TaxID=2925844 RepID=UPI001F533F26|nr:hypothetical protein [Microbacterium sp. H1-D42]UNK69447.1 hypothetical protein MNR00_09640 [Microbacterium sp. H1-D42]